MRKMIVRAILKPILALHPGRENRRLAQSKAARGWMAGLNWPAALFLLFLPASLLWGFTEATITIDGNFDDWAAVLADADNFITDGAKDAGDPDNPSQTTSDLRVFGLTWDAANLYFFFQRGSQSNAGISFIAYLDADRDGFLLDNEPVAFFNFNNSGFQSFALYAYNAVNDATGDPLPGDGEAPPGSLFTPPLSTAGTGAPDASGTRIEGAFPWAALNGLGIPTGAPMFLHPATALGTNLPTQVQDNGANLDTLFVALLLTPDHEVSAFPGETVAFTHALTNRGNGADTVDFSAVSLEGWALSFWDPAGGAPLADTNGDGYPDSGPIAAKGVFEFVLKAVVPSSIPTPSDDLITVKGTSSRNSLVEARARDLLHAGLAAFYPDQSKKGTEGSTIPFGGQIVANLQAQTVQFAISTESSQGWSREVFPDYDCDGTADGPAATGIAVGASGTACLITRVLIPPGTPLGTTDVTATTLAFGDPEILLTVDASTTVADPIAIGPPFIAAQGPGQAIFYDHFVENNQSDADTINLTSASSLSWTAVFFAADRLTPLTDTNGDSIVDAGSLAPHGGSRAVSVRISVPAAADYNQTDLSTLTARSTAAPTVAASVVDATTVKMLVFFSDPAYSQPTKYFAFSSCAPVYMKAFGLSTGTYRFMVYDSLGSLKTPSPVEKSPDQSGQITDIYQLKSGDPMGTWTGKVQKKSGGSWADVANYVELFFVVRDAVLSAQTGKPVYNLTDAGFSVTAQFGNPSQANYLGHSAVYVVFFDADGDDAPDAGEPHLTPGGAVGAWAAGLHTHRTDPIAIPAGAVTNDVWGITVADFVHTGTWKVQTRWLDHCGDLMQGGVTPFQVVSDAVKPVSSITFPADGAVLFLSGAPFIVEGTASDEGSGLARVDLSTDNGSTWAAAAGTEEWQYAWSAFLRGTYTLRSRAVDAVGNMEVPTAGVTVTIVDDTPPTTPVVTDDGVYTTSATALHAAWSSQDLNSGIAAYRYCIGTSAGACDVTAWLDVGTATEATRSGLTLIHGTTYYFNVVSTNLDGTDSAVGSSDGITCDRQGPSSIVTDPVSGQTLSGETYTIHGTAFDGHSGVASVEVSTDGGASWSSASGTTAWSRDWTLPADGNYIVHARARDEAGNLGPNSGPVPVKVDNPPVPPSNLTATPDGNCVVTLKWSPSPSPDVEHYAIYHNNGSGPVDYDAPVAFAGAGAQTWASSRGVYGRCGQDITLASEAEWTERSIAVFDIVNANKESFLVTGATVSWTGDTPARFLSGVELDGAAVFSKPPGTPGNNGSTHAFAPAVMLGPGQPAEARFHFAFVAGGYPEMEGNTLQVTLTGGPGPRITALLLTPGRIPDPCRWDDGQSLIVGADYTFGIRAFDAGGAHDGNTTVTVGTASCAPSLSTTVASPKAGQRVKGEEVTVFAELAFGRLADVKEVLFQYRSHPAGSWSDLPGTFEHPNPDPAWPYFTYWDASAFPEGDYDLRAVARHVLGYDDPIPPFATVSVVASGQNLLEGPVAGRHTAEEDVWVVSTGNRVAAGDDLHDNITQAWIPQNALTADTQCVAAIAADPGTVSPAWGSGLQFRGLSLASGQTAFAGGLLATVEIPYDDADGDGLVDGTATPEWNLALYHWDGGAWSASGIASSQVNTLTNVVRGSTSHFTLFAPLAEPPAADFTPPREVAGLKLFRPGRDLLFTWEAVTLDIGGGPEVIHHYNVYRGTAPNFVPDAVNRMNLIGVSSTTAFEQAGGADDGVNHYYLVTAVDRGYNEGAHQP